MTVKILPAEQKYHPDSRTGWSVTVLDSKGLLYARFYGETKTQAENRAKAFEADTRQPVAQSAFEAA